MTESIEGADGDMVEMVVAAGRTVQTGNPWRIEQQTIEGPGGPVMRHVQVPVAGKFTFTEGETVRLSRAEAKQSHALGFVLHPNEEGHSRPLSVKAIRNPDEIGLVGVEYH
jgi:hypothetical protein